MATIKARIATTILLRKLAFESTFPYSIVEEVTRWVIQIGPMVYYTAFYFTVFLFYIYIAGILS